MLRPYNFKHHKIHNIQSFVNHIVLDILCKAPQLSVSAKDFTSDLVLPKYKKLIDEVNPKYILTPISHAYAICRHLEKKQLIILKKAVLQNNQIRALCKGFIQPVLYSEIDQMDNDQKDKNQKLSAYIRTFCDELYDESIHKEVFYNQYGKIKDYYKALVGRSSVCCFCGINKVLTQHHSHRSAFDHYLPKHDYPFSSINFKNLVPLCDTCNSKYKLGKNTIFETHQTGKKKKETIRIKAFYPFQKNQPDIKINLHFKKPFSANVEPNDMTIDLICVGFEQEMRTWDRLFGIKENYLAACCTDEMYNYYEEQYLASLNYGQSHDDYIGLLQNNKFADMNFLKIAFLEAVQ